MASEEFIEKPKAMNRKWRVDKVVLSYKERLSCSVVWAESTRNTHENRYRKTRNIPDRSYPVHVVFCLFLCVCVSVLRYL
jgi:hypothetical protein